MKVIIDLIEDLREVLQTHSSLALNVMGLEEKETEVFAPTWQSNVVTYIVDDKAKALYLNISKEEAMDSGRFLKELDSLSNEQMMYEIHVSYPDGENKPLIGFGESIPQSMYLVFVQA